MEIRECSSTGCVQVRVNRAAACSASVRGSRPVLGRSITLVDRLVLRRVVRCLPPPLGQAVTGLGQAASGGGLWFASATALLCAGAAGAGLRAAGSAMVAYAITSGLANGPAKWLIRRPRPPDPSSSACVEGAGSRPRRRSPPRTPLVGSPSPWPPRPSCRWRRRCCCPPPQAWRSPACGPSATTRATWPPASCWASGWERPRPSPCGDAGSAAGPPERRGAWHHRLRSGTTEGGLRRSETWLTEQEHPTGS